MRQREDKNAKLKPIFAKQDATIDMILAYVYSGILTTTITQVSRIDKPKPLKMIASCFMLPLLTAQFFERGWPVIQKEIEREQKYLKEKARRKELKRIENRMKNGPGGSGPPGMPPRA